MKQKHKDCFICGNDKIVRKGVTKEYSLMKCSQCGLQFISYIPYDKTISSVYSNYYKAWNLTKFQKQVSEMKMKTFQGYLAQIAPFVSSGRLLDIGCATGELLEVACRLGFDVYGVEISPQGIKRCKEIFGEKKIMGDTLKKGDFPLGFFDVITISDVFEHIQEPESFINILYDILKPNGILMITTPDTSSWSNKIMGMSWPHYKQEHIYYYNSSNINQLFSKRFEVALLNPAHKVLTFQYCFDILYAYSNNIIIRKIVFLLKYLPDIIKLRTFRMNFGEMFVVLKKISKVSCS